MSHDYHDELPGFDERQILVDGCKECELRAGDVFDAMCHLDNASWVKAWRRAIAWQRWDGGGDLHLSQAEVPLLRALWGVTLGLERLGLKIVRDDGAPGSL